MSIGKLAFAGAVVVASAVPAAAQDWQGFYLGLSASSSDQALTAPGAPFDFPSSDTYVGVYAGYNHAFGSNLIVGGELSYGALDTLSLIGLSVTYDSLVQVRARLGFVMGDAMPYVALGAAQSDIGIPGSPSGSETGLAYGIGVDLKLGSNMSLRAEYGGASFDDTLQHLGAPPGFDAKYEALTLGLAWHF